MNKKLPQELEKKLSDIKFAFISDRKKFEEVLKVQQKEVQELDVKIRTVLESVVNTIIIIDEHGKIDSINPAGEKLFGYEEIELIGQNINVLMPEPHRTQHDYHIKRYLETGEKKIIGIGREVNAQHRDGTIFSIQLAVSEMRQDDKRMFIGVLHNITENKEKNVMLHIDNIFRPLLEKCKKKGFPREYTKLLEEEFDKTVASYRDKLALRHFNLTPREIEICDLIKLGCKTKEISDILMYRNFKVTHKSRQGQQKTYDQWEGC